MKKEIVARGTNIRKEKGGEKGCWLGAKTEGTKKGLIWRRGSDASATC